MAFWLAQVGVLGAAVKSETNWTAVGALAAVASAVIALLAYNAHAGGTSLATPPPTRTYYVQPVYEPPARVATTSVALSDLPNPCQVPRSSAISQFGMETGRLDDSMSFEKTCFWTIHPGGWSESVTVLLTLDTTRYSAESGSTPVSIAGVSTASEKRDAVLGGCAVEWPTSFGYVRMSAAGPVQYSSPAEDPCALIGTFAEALAPDVPS